MSTLWFDIMNTIDDDPDWSYRPEDFEPPKVERAYRKLERTISEKPKRFEDYSWLKPPEKKD